MWQFTGNQRPTFALDPIEGQESVWDYPRPPVCVSDDREVVVRVGACEIARSMNAVRVLETASPPTIYIPSEDVNLELLVKSSQRSFCEWKGSASYWSLVVNRKSVDSYSDDRPLQIRDCGWSYESPSARFAQLENHFSFYPGRVECWLGGERVRAQLGGFYGGWVTSEIVGPWKGEDGTGGW